MVIYLDRKVVVLLWWERRQHNAHAPTNFDDARHKNAVVPWADDQLKMDLATEEIAGTWSTINGMNGQQDDVASELESHPWNVCTLWHLTIMW